MQKNSPPQRKLWHRLLSVLMTLALIVTSIVGFQQSKETVKAEDLRMVVDRWGDITWDTTSHKSTASVRFRTIGWYFQFSYKDAMTGKIEQYPKAPIYAELVNGDIVSKINGRTVKVGTYDGSNGSSNSTANMSYSIYGLKDYYSGDDRVYYAVANARVEFYRIKSNGTTETIKIVNNKADADATAKSLGMNNGPYFTNYYNRQVDIPKVRLATTGDSHLESPTIDGSLGSSDTDTKAVEWVDKNSFHELKIDVKSELDGTKGYVCVSATKGGTGERIPDGEGGFSTTWDQGGLIRRQNAGSKNTTIVFHSKPLKVKVVYYSHDGKERYGSQIFTYDDGGQIAGTEEMTAIVNQRHINSWCTEKDFSDVVYRSFGNVDNNVMMDFYNRAGDFEPTKEVENGILKTTHVVKLYAKEDDEVIPPPESDPDYYIVYDGNGATSGKMARQPVKNGKRTMLTHIKYKKTGYHYNTENTWKSKKNKKSYKDCQNVSDSTLDFDDSAKKKVTLYAQWQPNKCKIQYDGNGSNGGVPVESQTITYDKWTQKIQTNTYTKDGVPSGGTWNTKPDGTGINISANTPINKTLWDKLFGEDANGKTVTLYAQWDGESDDDDDEDIIEQIGDGDLTYLSGEVGLNQSYGPEKYDLLSSVTIKECMFGDKYDENTTKVKKVGNGITVDGEEATHEADYLIRGGSNVLEVLGHYYTFQAWSVDNKATNKSSGVLIQPNSLVDGKTLAYTYYGYVNPVERNTEWDSLDESEDIPAPKSVMMPTSSVRRASTITSSRNAWLEYVNLLNGRITAKTNDISDYKEKIEDIVDEIDYLTARLKNISYPSTPDITYPSPLPSHPTKAQKKAYEEAVKDYNQAWNKYNSDYSDVYHEELNLKDRRSKKQEELINVKKVKAKAKELRDSAIATLNSLNKNITSTIQDPKGTFLNAVWDQYPEFEEMDPIHVFKSDNYDYMTDDWLLKFVTVNDREDGKLINGKDVTVENFDPEELKQLQHTGAASVTFRATDSAKNVTRYTVTIVVEDRTPLEKTLPDDLSGKLYYENSYPRFICREAFEIGDPDSPNYFGSGYNGTTTNMYGQKVPVYLYVGGLHPQSRWYTDDVWKKEIYQGFENEENDTPEEVWEFTHQDILDIQKYVDDNGLGDMNGEGNLDKFYQEFAPRCQTEYHADRITY